MYEGLKPKGKQIESNSISQGNLNLEHPDNLYLSGYTNSSNSAVTVGYLNYRLNEYITGGTSGTDGTSGSSGIDGSFLGTHGTSGSSGINGSSGTSGTSGISGSSGVSGTSGKSGRDGIDGARGSQGTSGTSGETSTSGTSGSSGISGTSGLSGTSGTSGSSGTSGTSGTSGSSGTSGTSGSSGTSGTSGTSGLSGDIYTTTSINSLSIGSGIKTLDVDTGLALSLGQIVNIVYNTGNTMEGTIISYSSITGELIVNVYSIYGSGNYNDWKISLKGATGPSGSSGSSGLDGNPDFLLDDDLYFDTITNTLYTPNICLTGSTVTVTNIQDISDNNTKLVLGIDNVIYRVTGITTGTSGSSGVSGSSGFSIYNLTKTLNIQNPTSSNDVVMWFTFNAITATTVQSVIKGSGTSVTIEIVHGTDRSDVGTSLLSTPIEITSKTTGQTLTSFNQAEIEPNSFIRLKTTAISGIIDELSVTIRFIE